MALISTILAASWLDALLGLRGVSWWDEATSLGFRFPLPAWGWALVVLAAGGVGVWSYRRLSGGILPRVALATLRGLVVLAVAVLLARPELVRTDELIEPDWVLVLVDRSASLQIQDTPATGDASTPASSGDLISREAALERAMRQHGGVLTQQALGSSRRVAWLGFGEQAFAVDPGELGPAAAPATAIRTAVEQALQVAAGRPISGIVLITDGRTPQLTGADLVARLKARSAAVFAVPLGAERTPLDLAVASVEAPERAFKGDLVPVVVRVDAVGSDEELATLRNTGVRVRLIDTAGSGGEAVLEETVLTGDAVGEPVRLTGRAERVGPTRWRVEVRRAGPSTAPDAPDSAPDASPELVLDNNRRAVQVEVIDRPVRVLYVEGPPRTTYHYLKNMLVREASISSSVLLTSADRSFAQEGDVPLTRLPQTAQELNEFDVVIVGDVPPEEFSREQIALLRDFVANGGGGLLWIGGERYTPRSFAETPLADLLPMRRAGEVDRLTIPGGIAFRPTRLAADLGVMQLRDPQQPNQVADASGVLWPESLPPLLWAQEMGPLKPGAEVLAVAASATQDEPPLVARLRYGRGQAVYLGTDEAWRWRYGRGDLFFDQFFIQLVRMLGKSRLQGLGEQARLEVSRRRAQLGDTLVVELELTDPALIERRPASVRVTIHDAADPEGPASDALELRPEAAGEADGEGALAGGAARLVYRALWRADTPGDLLLRADDPVLGGLDPTADVTIVAPDDELRQVQTDHPRLAFLANETGGRVVPLSALATLPDLLPQRARRVPNDVTEPIWNSPLALAVVLVLLTLEWVGRKALRLV